MGRELSGDRVHMGPHSLMNCGESIQIHGQALRIVQRSWISKRMVHVHIPNIKKDFQYTYYLTMTTKLMRK